MKALQIFHKNLLMFVFLFSVLKVEKQTAKNIVIFIMVVGPIVGLALDLLTGNPTPAGSMASAGIEFFCMGALIVLG